MTALVILPKIFNMTTTGRVKAPPNEFRNYLHYDHGASERAIAAFERAFKEWEFLASSKDKDI